MIGPREPASEALHGMKYRQKGETFKQAIWRISRACSDYPDMEAELYRMMAYMRWLPAGRIQNAMGATKDMTALNCYVSGTIEDNTESILERCNEGFRTMRRGGGIGFDFSNIRPKGHMIRSLESAAAGPIPFMGMYNGMGLCVSTAGHRRGAMMAILRVDHPDIEEFIEAKQNAHALTGFNISIAVTDKFMEAVEKGELFELKFEGVTCKIVDARALWNKIMLSTWDWAEPGVVFIDRINDWNNLFYCETIAATNPCGEQPLPPFGACLLGSLNLPKYLVNWGNGYELDYALMKHDIPFIVRMMDNIIDKARYPLREQREEMQTKRRVGIGITGAANAGEALGYSYGSDEFIHWLDLTMGFITSQSYIASAKLAEERGPFDAFEDVYLQSKFIRSLDPDIQALIAAHGIRNSHLTSIAPTGTISFCADNVSSGIEPVFSYGYERPVNTPDGRKVFQVEDYGVKYLGVQGVTADKVTPEQHVRVLATVQKHVDSAVSKTCNVDNTTTFEQFQTLYMAAWKMGAKGCTTFRQDGKRMALLTAKPVEASSQTPEPSADYLEGTGCRIDRETGRRECA